MFEALTDIACFVTGFVSFLYGTRVAWICGKKCQIREATENKAQLLFKSMPAATLIYFVGFLMVFSYLFSGFITWVVFSATSATILSTVVLSMAIPELKRMPANSPLILVELKNGVSCRMEKKSLNSLLESNKVLRFKRSDGWVVVGEDKLRAPSVNSFYAGYDRRVTP